MNEQRKIPVNFPEMIQEELDCIQRWKAPEFPIRRGIVICAAKVKYEKCATALISLLRQKLNSSLPICIARLPWEDQLPIPAYHLSICPLERRKPGYALKVLACLSCPFKEFILLDADTFPTFDPEEIFSWEGFQQTGATFFSSDNHISMMALEAHGVKESLIEWETGQFALDKSKHWHALSLASWLCNWSANSFRLTIGDPEALTIAWKLCGNPSYTPPFQMIRKPRSVLHYDENGRLAFCHRIGDKELKERLDEYPLEDFLNHGS